MANVKKQKKASKKSIKMLKEIKDGKRIQCSQTTEQEAVKKEHSEITNSSWKFRIWQQKPKAQQLGPKTV